MDFLISHEATLIGLIFMLVLGPAVGNYACSVVYRLPLGKTPFERHPYCGSCDADLKPIDLFPIFSWLMTGGKCRYCRKKIPSIYTVIEIACGALFIANFLKFGMGEQFLLYTAYGVFVIILASIEWRKGFLADSIYVYALTCVALARTLDDGTIFGWIADGFLMMVMVLSVYWLKTKLRKAKFHPLTVPWIWWLVLMGTVLPRAQWELLYIPVAFLVLSLLAEKKLRKFVLLPLAISALVFPLVLP